jgi:hypothetical protein
MNFPTVSGSNLLRQKLVLPHDFQGELNIVFVAFLQWQQMEVNSWIPLAKELEEQTKGLYYYELPTIQSRNVFSRTFINEGMRAGIPNRTSRERTITLYLNKASFRRDLGMLDEDHIYVLIVDRLGKVLLSTRGSYTPEAGELLRQTINSTFTRLLSVELFTGLVADKQNA